MPGKKQYRPTDPKPLCRCGCGQRVKLHRHKWLLAHYTSERRAETNRRHAVSRRYRMRRRRFAADVDRLLANGRTITRADLMDLMAVAHERGYQTGYHASEKKQARQQPKAA